MVACNLFSALQVAMKQTLTAPTATPAPLGAQVLAPSSEQIAELGRYTYIYTKTLGICPATTLVISDHGGDPYLAMQTIGKILIPESAEETETRLRQVLLSLVESERPNWDIPTLLLQGKDMYLIGTIAGTPPHVPKLGIYHPRNSIYLESALVDMAGDLPKMLYHSCTTILFFQESPFGD